MKIHGADCVTLLLPLWRKAQVHARIRDEDSRFREAYSLCRDREAKPIFESLKYGMDMMFNRRLNPAIIAACKTQEQLSNYLTCLEKNDLKSFTDFEIKFEMNLF